MSAYETVESVAAVALVATGLSHWLHHDAWADLFARWAEAGRSGALMNGLIHAGVGAVFLTAHPVFTGASSVLTWWAVLVTAKGLLYIVLPSVGVSSMRRLTRERAAALRWVGLPMIGLGVAIGLIAIL